MKVKRCSRCNNIFDKEKDITNDLCWKCENIESILEHGLDKFGRGISYDDTGNSLPAKTIKDKITLLNRYRYLR